MINWRVFWWRLLVTESIKTFSDRARSGFRSDLVKNGMRMFDGISWLTSSRPWVALYKEWIFVLFSDIFQFQHFYEFKGPMQGIRDKLSLFWLAETDKSVLRTSKNRRLWFAELLTKNLITLKPSMMTLCFLNCLIKDISWFFNLFEFFALIPSL